MKSYMLKSNCCIWNVLTKVLENWKKKVIWQFVSEADKKGVKKRLPAQKHFWNKELLHLAAANFFPTQFVGQRPWKNLMHAPNLQTVSKNKHFCNHHRMYYHGWMGFLLLVEIAPKCPLFSFFFCCCCSSNFK